MDYDNDVQPINNNLKCHVCGENKFDERDGFYHCQECGTRQEQVCVEEIEDFDFTNENLKSKKIKIQTVKPEKPQLTSWECYNYILRGYVEELLSYGAKNELKLMTLQVWAAYLRRMEVAFFSRKQQDLPKLGVKYLENDAEVIYNHKKEAVKKRRVSKDTSCTSGDESRSHRDFRKNKRKLDESSYSQTSGASGFSAFTSSKSANSNKAIKLSYNSKARRFLKKTMPKKHLDKHAVDSEGLLTCHKQPKAREIKRSEYKLMLMNIKQIYSILAIALNLIDDEIQLSDLIRFINEGHISSSNILEYFPENITGHVKEMLKKINFYKCPEKYSDKCLREHIGIIIKNIGINKPKKPDLHKLVLRYTTELCLPNEIAVYIGRLINLLPPQFETRTMGCYPGFEARAMAYIIFTLKLLFGLDGFKEHRMSLAAEKLNNKIEELNQKRFEKQPLLFVWDEWVEYIEMRKIIISQFNSSFCEQFKQCQSTAQLLEQMKVEMSKNEERENLFNEKTDNLKTKQKFKAFKSLFERFQETYKVPENDKKSVKIIDFKPTFTPAYTYLKNIILHSDGETNTDSSLNTNIPDFMRIDHAQRDISSYIRVKPLIEYFKRHKLKLSVHVINTTENKEYVGIFRAPRTKNYNFNVQKACFDVTDEEWVEHVKNNVSASTDDLGFKTDLSEYGQGSHNYRKRIENKKDKIYNKFMNYDLTLIKDDTDDEGDKEKMPNINVSEINIKNNTNISPQSVNINGDLQSMHSFKVFSENNMEPVDTPSFITAPRRNLDEFDLFEGISDEESLLNVDDGDNNDRHTEHSSEYANNASTSKQDSSLPPRSSSPSIFEEFVKDEQPSPSSSGNKSKQKDKTSNDKALKFYISNMDCWILMGNILMLTKVQRSQLQDKFTRSFTWLIETCAQTINVEWSAVYEQLLCIELMFGYGIKDPNTIKNCVFMNAPHPNKDMQCILATYREIW